MALYDVFCDGNKVGQVQGNTDREAIDNAYTLRKWSPREAMKLEKRQERKPVMHILFDANNGRALARHESYKALAALHYIQFANVDGLIVRCGLNRSYTVLSMDQMETALTYAGFQDIPDQYSDRLKLLRGIEDAPWLLLPFTAAELERQAYAIDPNDARPMAFEPGADSPVVLPRWTSDPQANRKRADSSFWINFASGEPSGHSRLPALPDPSAGGTVPRRNSPLNPQHEDPSMASTKPAKKAATKKATKKSAPAKKAAAKKAAPAKAAASTQEERNGVKRPKPGGNTAQVWDACDTIHAKKGSAPTFKEVDEYIEKKNADIPTATRRSNYAVWRKFNGITGRVSE